MRGNGYLVILVGNDMYGDKETLMLKVNMREGDGLTFNRLVGHLCVMLRASSLAST